MVRCGNAVLGFGRRQQHAQDICLTLECHRNCTRRRATPLRFLSELRDLELRALDGGKKFLVGHRRHEGAPGATTVAGGAPSGAR
jgi:hypothetical protein